MLADEAIPAIEKYIYVSDSYVVYIASNRQPIAVFVLYRLNDDEVEIKNIAVAKKSQGNGIGSWLLKEIKKLTRGAGYQYLWVGTADVGYRQQQFYLRNGFEQSGIRKDFFTENYPEPIYENGKRSCKWLLFSGDGATIELRCGSGLFR